MERIRYDKSIIKREKKMRKEYKNYCQNEIEMKYPVKKKCSNEVV